VKPQYGLTDDEVEKMLLDSLTHAKEDIQVRALVEAQTEAKQLLDATGQFIQKNKSLLQVDELAETESAMASLQALIATGNKDEIHTAIEKLNEISRPYAERVMDQAISTAMKGKNIME
jgi:molecular chaperone HscA